MYKGSGALLAHALLTAHAHGVLPQVLDDLRDSFPKQIDRAARLLAGSATKADRYVGEMREIAATQAAAGLTPALFDAMAEVYEAVARSSLAAEAPEAIPPEPELEDVLARIAPARATGDVRRSCHSAGERTRTSKGRSPPGPKPGASASSATPAQSKNRVRTGNRITISRTYSFANQPYPSYIRNVY